ncbi:MAG: trehalase family glycosidase [Candidatus Velthaea sp.]
MKSAHVEALGTGERIAMYSIADDAMAAGSTLGGPKVCATIKATGALEKMYASDAGATLTGTLVVHHWDERTGIELAPLPGRFEIRPEAQEHFFTLSNGVDVHETIFVLSGAPDGDDVDPPAVYYTLELHNETREALRLGTYAFCELRGHTAHDVRVVYDAATNVFVAWNASQRNHVRTFALSKKPTSYETTIDRAKAVSDHWPGKLSCETNAGGSDPLAIFHSSHALAPGATARIAYTISFALDGRKRAEAVHRSCPKPAAALARTRAYYEEILGRSVVITPDAEVNRGVLWAKANMLRTQLLSPTGWSFVNDPTRSNNSVGRDTAWFSFGADYITPDFARESLLAYVQRQERSGMIVEYYDIRNGRTADYRLNINDNTPLLVLALWHHYNVSGDRRFLRRVYAAAVKAARYILSQRNAAGLVWCTATGTADWGIVGWRNVIAGYRLSGATTELNSECYAALDTVAHMARELGDHAAAEDFANEAAALKTAINTHLFNPTNGLYYLNIEIDGTPRSDVTSDLVFPVMFGVADDETAARIISRLSSADFWTDAGIRTVPRDAPSYGPTHGYGLLGGVWVGVTFWFAFAAARFSSDFMAYALSTSFGHYSTDPRKNNTVPGQFSEWLHGETLTNQGMMLSPWFPPRYLWAAIEGAAGFDVSGGRPSVSPRLAPDWKWLGVRNLPYAGRALTWFVARAPEMQLYANFALHQSAQARTYARDISARLAVSGNAVCALGLRDGRHLVLFAGNTVERTVSTAVGIDDDVAGTYRTRIFNSLRGAWIDGDPVTADALRTGLPLQLERKGFVIIELEQVT